MSEQGEIAKSLRIDTPSDYVQTISSLKQLVESLDLEAGANMPRRIGHSGSMDGTSWCHEELQ